LSKTQDAAAKVIGDPAKVSAALADLKAGLDEWKEGEIHPKILHTPRHATAFLLRSHIAHQAAQKKDGLEQFFLGIERQILECFEVRFSSGDWPDWAASFFAWIASIVPAGWPAPDPTADPVGNNFASGVLGDFGTGLYGVPACQQSTQESQEEYALMLHLGDVYYSAMPEEVGQRFFQFWPDKAPLNRAMNGNHEMYTGGHTFFETMSPRFDQKAGCFAMQNDNWVLIALDTAYHQAFGGQEGVLDDPQMNWLSTIVERAAPRKVVLCSHPQPSTQLDTNQGGNLLAQMKSSGWRTKSLRGAGATSIAACFMIRTRSTASTAGAWATRHFLNRGQTSVMPRPRPNLARSGGG
jgi:hypothetical protein